MQPAKRNSMVDWQVAPAYHEIVNYDDVKIKYRESVQDITHSYPDRSLKKMTFITISTNVMCAEIESSVTQSRPHVEPIERDIYLPLEICLVKTTVRESRKENQEERKLNTRFWMFNPGSPPANGSVKWSEDHKSYHKIDYDKFGPSNSYVTKDFRLVVKCINSFLTSGRIVYSTNLRNCRQDLGCLKWLNRKANFIMKPVKVFSIEDLYVVLNKRLYPTLSQGNHICLGVLRARFEASQDTNKLEIQCRYHQNKRNKDEDAATSYCAQAVATCWARFLLDEIHNFNKIEEDQN